jgi:hypothetical protein
VAAAPPAWPAAAAAHGRFAVAAGVLFASACPGVGAVRPPPLFLGLALVILLSIPWTYAVARRLASQPAAP